MRERNEKTSFDGRFIPRRDAWGRWYVGKAPKNRITKKEKGEISREEKEENDFRHSHFVSDVGFQFPEGGER